MSLPIPVSIVQRHVPPPPEEAEESPEPADLRRIVMVEDDLTLQQVVNELLIDDDLTCFSEGPQALEHCRGGETDLVLLDLTLQGGWDGWRVLEELAELEEPPPVILTTGSIEVTADELEYPQIELLRKPFRLDELEGAVNRALGTPA